MRFSDSLVAVVSASRTLGPPAEYLRIHGKERYVTLEKDCLTVCSHEGRLLERRELRSGENGWAQRLLEMFVQHLEKPEQYPLFPPPETDLRTMAVLEAAYLSAKTGMPELPSRILELAGFKPDGLW
jgi:predicted dehydrogenase